MAMIADIARYEIVYRHGGFYFDTNYLVFNNNTLDQFLTYTFMDAAQISPRQRILRDNGVFGAAKNHPHLARLVSHRTLSNMNHFEWLAIKETGPSYFGRVQRGKE
jgi:mannosyltransferase OCH1-like enzyme